MTQQQMLNQMCGYGLAQGDAKAIGRSRGFDSEVVASRALLQHVFLSEQGVRAALMLLTEAEIIGLHLLHHLGEAVGLEFFKRVYPGSMPAGYGTHTARFKGILHQVKTNLIRRGILVFSTLPQGLDNSSVSERLRFRFPEEFAPFLPAPFSPRRLAAGASPQCRKGVVQDKLAEILRLDGAPVKEPTGGEGCWRLNDGELLFGGKRFSAERFKTWPVRELAAGFSANRKGKTDEFSPVPMLLYALSRLGEDEWLAVEDLRPLWKRGFPGAKVPEPRMICEAGFSGGLLEKAEQDGTMLYRWQGLVEAAGDTPPEHFLTIHDSREIRIHLDRIPLEALEQLSRVSRLKVAGGSLRAMPSLLKISHAPAGTLEAAVCRWLRENHLAFKAAVETIEQKRGKLIVHENLLVAKVSDPALKVMLEKEFAAPGQLSALSGAFVAFPMGLLPKVQSWMKKSGHVIKTIASHDRV